LHIVGQAGAENARWHALSKQFAFIINELYADALKVNPDYWIAEHAIGMMLLEKHNRPDAIASFNKALEINPQAAPAMVGLGLAALDKYDLDAAESMARKALAVNPTLIAAHVLLADVQIVAGDYPAARSALQKALAVNPKHEAAAGKLAGVLWLEKKPGEAEALRKTVEAFDAKPGVFHFEFGSTLEHRKHYDAAEAAYKLAAELRPKFAEPRTALGMLYMRMGRESDGRTLLDAAFARDKFNVRVANSRKVLDHLEKYSTLETAHYVIRFDPAKDKLLAEFVAESLEATHTSLKSKYGYEPPTKTPFQIFSRHDMFSGRTTGLPDLHTVGASTGRIVAMASPTAAGIVKPFHWGRVVRHELTHVFNLSQTNMQCPHWLTEGLAVRNEETARPLEFLRVLRTARESKSTFTLDTIMRGFAKPKQPSEWTLAYAQSNLYVEYIIKLAGEAAIARALKAYGDGLDTEAVIRLSVSMSMAEFEQGYLDFVDVILQPYMTKTLKFDDNTAALEVDDLKKLLLANPKDTNAKARLAERMLQQDKPAEARRLADEALSADKGHPVASNVKAKLYLLAGDTDEAKTVLETALVAKPDDARLLMTLAKMYIDAKEDDLAIATLESGKRLAPLDGDWDAKLMPLYTQADATDKLIKTLEAMCGHDPDDMIPRLMLAKVLLGKDKITEGLKVAREAIEFDVMNADAQALYVEALERTGDTKTAELMKKRFAKD
jgi:cellulose synthase operon protein C